MKKLLTLTLIPLFAFTATYSQGLGIQELYGNAADQSAMLDVNHRQKGVLIPRVYLAATNNSHPVLLPRTSLLIYNVESSGSGATAVTPGFYYWNGSAWVRFTDASNSRGANVYLGSESGTGNTGYSNIAIGAMALYSNSTISNLIAIGDSALYSNTTGFFNTAVGSKALFANTTGNRNTATGFASLKVNTIGTYNTGYAYNSLASNTTGNFNTAVGVSALFANTAGNDNTGMGVSALTLNSTGSSNTAIGRASLGSNTTGNNNTAIGKSADVGAAGLSNATAIGSGAVVQASNTVQVGNSAVTNVFFGNGTATLHGSTATPSDKRFKYNIKSNVPGLDFITKLQPVTYNFDNQKLDEFAKTGIVHNNLIRPASYTGDKQIHTGFLAQDVERIARDLGYDFDGVKAPKNDKDFYKVSYSQFIMPLVKSVQEQQQTIEDQNKKIDGQQQQINKMNERIEELAKALKALTHK
ncbi:MAG TPA: tail fiber domain-containing protein [Segetibacter sp.]